MVSSTNIATFLSNNDLYSRPFHKEGFVIFFLAASGFSHLVRTGAVFFENLPGNVQFVGKIF